MEEKGSRESVLNNDWSLQVLKIEAPNKKYMQHTEAEKKHTMQFSHEAYIKNAPLMTPGFQLVMLIADSQPPELENEKCV